MLLVVIREILLILDASQTMSIGICLKDQNHMDMFHQLVMKLARNITILLYRIKDGVFVEMSMQLSLNMYKDPTANAVAMKV